MIRKVTFIMTHHSAHVHSNRFNTLSIGDMEQVPNPEEKAKLEKANFYIPKPLADGAKKIRVTIEVVE